MFRHWKTHLPLCPIWPATAEIDGILVPIRDSPFPAPLRRHLMNGGYEQSERRLVQDFVCEGDRVLELGASAGVVTSFLLRQVGRSGRVVSVEGNSTLKAAFEAQQAANGFQGEWVQTLCRPTWETVLPQDFDPVRLMLHSNPLGSSVNRGDGTAHDVGWRTARQICETAVLEPTVLIADIEGSEAVWIDTPPEIPSSVRLVIIEFHPDILGSARAGQCVQALIHEGFKVCGMLGGVLALAR